MSDLKLLADLITAMDIWPVAIERLEAIDFQERHRLTSRDTYCHERMLSPIDESEPSVLSSSINARISGTYGFAWVLTVSAYAEAAEISGKVFIEHSISELLRQVNFERVDSLEDAVVATQRIGEELVDDFIQSVKQESLYSLWQRLCPPELINLPAIERNQ